MIKVFYNDNTMILLDGIAQKDNPFDINDYIRHSIMCLPLCSEVLCYPICGYITVSPPYNVITNIDYIRVNNYTIELNPIFKSVGTISSPDVLKQYSFEEHTATVYTDSEIHLLIECETHFINLILPQVPYEVKTLELGDAFLFVALCEMSIHITHFNGVDYNCVLDKKCNSYEFDSKGVSCVTELNDNVGRRLIEHYSFDGYCYLRDNVKYEYTNSHTVIDELIPYDFIDAILSDDSDYAQNLLASDISSNLKGIKAFFGKIMSVYRNIDCDIEHNEINVLTMEENVKVIKKYIFVINNHKIQDIDCLQ